MEGRLLERMLDEPLDWRFKSLPATAEPLTLAELGTQGWNILAGDLPLPVMLLKDSALEHNLAAMAGFCRERGVDIAPHGKTTMAPQLVKRQLDAGAWAVTAATAAQARVFRALGAQRVLVANQLLDPEGLRWAAAELAADPGFELLCLVDSVAGVERMGAALTAAGATRPLAVLVELGFSGGRTGARQAADAEAVAAAVRRTPALRLAGVEAYEGVIRRDTFDATVAAVDEFLGRVRELVTRLGDRGAFSACDEVLVTAGGSAFFDRVAERLGGGWRLDRPVRVVLRSGCYLTHDSGMYGRLSPFGDRALDGRRLRPALELWGVVLSCPEPELAIAGFGKRDVPFDVDLPFPHTARGAAGARDVTGRHRVVALNDQHAYLRLPADDPLAPGDLLGCGISHPCTAFDKWSLLPLVDDHYTVVGGVRTFF